jgi:hypothetical protein
VSILKAAASCKSNLIVVGQVRYIIGILTVDIGKKLVDCARAEVLELDAFCTVYHDYSIGGVYFVGSKDGVLAIERGQGRSASSSTVWRVFHQYQRQGIASWIAY